jgi:subtilisin
VRRRTLLVSLLLLTLATPTAHAGEIVVFEDSADVAAETAERERELGFDAGHTYRRALKGFAAELSPEQEQALRDDPEVAAIIPDRPVRKLAAVAPKPGTVVPPGVRRALQAPAGVVRQTATSSVAVLDSGVDLEHPDLDVTAGVNCATSGAPDDIDGHGTHVAGTIAAKDDGAGVVGVAPGTRIIAVKVLDDTGMGTTSTVLCGIDWVIANRAALDIEVANLSLGGAGVRSTCATDVEHNGYCRLAAAGVTTVVAAGNDGWDLGEQPPDIPASYPEVLTVSAMTDTDGVPGGNGPAPTCSAADADDRFAGFSNYATLPVDTAHLVAAPGVCIRSTYPGGGTARMSGTSMAAPHVAGLVALCHGEAGAEGPCSALTPAQVIRRMVDTANAASGTSFASDATNPARRYGPFAVLPGETTTPPAPDPEPQPEPQQQQQPATETVVNRPAPVAEPLPGPGDQPTTAPVPAVQPVPEPLPPAVALPSPRLRITPARLTRFLRSGLTAQVLCPTRCRATVRLTTVRMLSAKRPSIPATLARASTTATGAVTLRPTKAVRRALRDAKRLVVTVEATVGTVRLRRTVVLS